jgi:hypothetical protein
MLRLTSNFAKKQELTKEKPFTQKQMPLDLTQNEVPQGLSVVMATVSQKSKNLDVVV